jgi:hypothetical protein
VVSAEGGHGISLSRYASLDSGAHKGRHDDSSLSCQAAFSLIFDSKREAAESAKLCSKE